MYELNRGTQQWEILGRKYVEGDTEGTNLGRSVSLAHNGETILFAVGFPGPGINEDSDIKSGVEVYSITENGVWDYYGQYIFPKEQYDDTGFKVQLSLDGQILAVSSPQYGLARGLVRMYKYNKNNPDHYQQVGKDIIGEKDNDEFGFAISLSRDGNVVSIGAPNHSYVSTFVISGASVGFSYCIVLYCTPFT